ncbi:hypothetical protein W911_15755 [Hyphomicrobium nitrativorans NL23]|uniref:Uncharacterized protein n=1 Tax=Hyphomicrobium nitrativorans NL23 TaxID=1029756 RepID=V5SIM9_9HYPH|nr:hypothetical protein [Hyphomicrobium nitrativorans]AHB50393.1 hypothetical protein W911_15755 [Hyphomicrobium nitrativorans NL23]
MAEAVSRASGSFRRGIEYILGRNTLIGIASLALLAISGYATWHGMRDFIIGVSATPTQPTTAPLTISTDALVIAVVVTLTFLMWLMLRETFGGWREFRNRVITFILYVFLAIWSIGFGYGFWWALISGEEATRTGLAGLQEDARDASAVIAARLDAVRSQLDSVVSWSESQMAREETSGGSCGTPSGAGRGPLYNARRSVRDGVATLRDGMTRSWLEPVQAEVEQLRASASLLEGGTVEERQRAFEARASEIRGSARNIAARSNELGKATAAEMRALAETVSVSPGQPGFSCYDPTLAQRLTQAAGQADQPAEVMLRDAAFSEGPAGVANAVKNLWTNIGTYTGSLVRFVFTWGNPGESTTDTGQPITGRDLIALLASIGIDLGILVLAILNPPLARPEMPRDLRRQIRSAVDTAIARAPSEDIEWVRRHFIYHRTASYLVIPNLYGADPKDHVESAKALAMNQLAGVLDDLDLIEWPSPGWPKSWDRQLIKGDLKKLRDEETEGSDTDLSEIRKSWIAKRRAKNADLVLSEKDAAFETADPLRNHGLFSKAERALEIAGWSESARRDIEVYRLVDTEGLTPILGVLNDNDSGEAPNVSG